MYETVKDVVSLTKAIILHRKEERRNAERYAVCRRVRRCLNAQSISPLQLLHLFPNTPELNAATVVEDDALLPLLNHARLQRIAELFGVDRTWLDTGSGPIYPMKFAYKNLQRALTLMTELRKSGCEVKFVLVNSATSEPDLNTGGRDMVCALRTSSHDLGAKSVWFDQPFADKWAWHHPPARIQLIAMTAAAWENGFEISGCSVPPKKLNSFRDGKLLIAELLKHRVEAWHPDDYIFTTDESVCAKNSDDALEARLLLQRVGFQLSRIKPEPRAPA